MRAEANALREQLATWRAAGDDRLDPPRFRFLEALAARMEDQSEAARELLRARLATLVQRYADDLAAARAAAAAEPDVRLQAAVGGAFSPLLAQLAAGRRRQGHAEATGPAQLPALAGFRQLWSDLLGERRLRQSLAPVPADAGPLNSVVLVHRAIALMREASPDYLRHFLAYADHLCWLERLHDARGTTTTTASNPRRATTRKPRKRRE